MIIKMDINNKDFLFDITEPSQLKLLEFDDLSKYLIKKNKLIDYNILLKYNFTTSEINWLFEEHGEWLNMHNEKILRQTNEIVKKLEFENMNLRNEIERLNKKINSSQLKNNIKNKLKFIEHNDNWVVYENKNSHIINKRNVKIIENIINLLYDDDKEYLTYREIAQNIILKYRLQIDIESFNGGKNRSKYMFPLYYYPIKILEYLNIIKYKAGKIYSIKNK
jgi:IS1 family transposase